MCFFEQFKWIKLLLYIVNSKRNKWQNTHSEKQFYAKVKPSNSYNSGAPCSLDQSDITMLCFTLFLSAY